MRQRRLAVGGLVLAAAMVLTTAGSHACVFGPSVFLTPASVKAGEALQVEGLNFRPDTAVVVRMSTLEGPTLAQLGVPQGDRRIVTGPVTIPATTAPGHYVLVFAQPGADGAPVQVPTRALVTVLGSGGAEPVVGRPAGLADGAREAAVVTEDSSVGAGLLLLVGFGAAIGLMLVAGGIALGVGRRSPARQAENVRA